MEDEINAAFEIVQKRITKEVELEKIVEEDSPENEESVEVVTSWDERESLEEKVVWRWNWIVHSSEIGAIGTREGSFSSSWWWLGERHNCRSFYILFNS